MSQFVYRVDKLNLHDWTHATERDVSECVAAVVAVLRAYPDVTADALNPVNADYWLTHLPAQPRIVVCRFNPHDAGYVVSPVALPWLGIEHASGKEGQP
jgi:hypothetical protein